MSPTRARGLITKRWSARSTYRERFRRIPSHTSWIALGPLSKGVLSPWYVAIARRVPILRAHLQIIIQLEGLPHPGFPRRKTPRCVARNTEEEMQFTERRRSRDAMQLFALAQGGDVDTLAWPGCCLCATSMERSICVISRVGKIYRAYFVNSFLFCLSSPSSFPFAGRVRSRGRSPGDSRVSADF